MPDHEPITFPTDTEMDSDTASIEAHFKFPASERKSPMTISKVDEEHDHGMEILLQPQTHPVPRDQLIVELKGIYITLKLNGTHIDEYYKQPRTTHLSDGEWDNLVILHDDMLKEYHDFLCASYYPTDGNSVEKVIVKYAIPEQFLDRLYQFLRFSRRGQLAAQKMLGFVWKAYQMLGLFHEKYETFRDVWSEGLMTLSFFATTLLDEDTDEYEYETWCRTRTSWDREATKESVQAFHRAVSYIFEEKSHALLSEHNIAPFANDLGRLRQYRL